MKHKILCIGATLVDELYFCETMVVPNSSNPAQKATSIGGVISNIVQHLALLDCQPALLTAVGSDVEGKHILDNFTHNGIDCSACITAPESTGKYVSVVNNDGNLFVAVCQDNCGHYVSVDYLQEQTNYISAFDLLIIDTNLQSDVIQWLIQFAKQLQKLLIIEPVSVSKAAKLASLDLNGVFMITPNQEELLAISTKEVQQERQAIQSLLDRGVASVWLRKGAQGSVFYTSEDTISLAVPKLTIVDSTGAGDAALAGWVFGYIKGKATLPCLQLGHTLALHILQRKGTVDSTLTTATLNTLMKIYYND